MVIRMREFDWEILIGEVSPPSFGDLSEKVQSDRSKLVVEMKDVLDLLLNGPLCNAMFEEVQRVFIMGMQVTRVYHIYSSCH